MDGKGIQEWSVVLLRIVKQEINPLLYGYVHRLKYFSMDILNCINPGVIFLAAAPNLVYM